MTIKTHDIDALTPGQAEVIVAEKFSQTFAECLALGESARVILSGNKCGAQPDLPVSAAKLLLKIFVEISKGNAVKIVALKLELTTEEAAGMLKVLRSHLVKLLERGDLPSHELERIAAFA